MANEPLSSKQKGDLEWYMSEIERLTRERDSWAGQVKDMRESHQRTMAERDRLLKENDELRSLAAGDHEDNTRLRAVLEHVAYSGCPYETCVTIAKSGLAGAAVEAFAGMTVDPRPVVVYGEVASDPPTETTPYCPHGFNAYCNICGDLLRPAENGEVSHGT